MGDFAEAMHVDPSTATRAVGKLEAVGFAERTADAGDRRVVVVRVTALGRRTIDDMLVRRSLGMERLLETFSTTEREQFAEYLERLVAGIDQLVAELGAATPGPNERG